MPLDPLTTLEGRHLALSYVVVFVLQGGYFVWVVTRWLKLRK